MNIVGSFLRPFQANAERGFQKLPRSLHPFGPFPVSLELS